MKKLMFAAGVAAIAGGAFAHPEVYEYKASLKNMYLQEKKVQYKDSRTYSTVTATVYMKYQVSTSLKGWLIMDADGVTSPTIMTDRKTLLDDLKYVEGATEQETVEGGYLSPSTGYDYGRNRGFLVVINPGAHKKVRHPKILPAILDGKWIDTDFAKLGTANAGLAEGNLYVGGDAVKPVRPQLDFLDSTGKSTERSYIPYVPYTEVGDSAVTNYTGMVAVADYAWTSIYLFSKPSPEKEAFFNGPNWFEDGFNKFEFYWDQNLPELLQTGWTTNSAGVATKKSGLPKNYFHDTWMNGAGVGKWSRGEITQALCCGADESTGDNNVNLESLSGNLKGGLFLCTENGIVVASKNYYWFGGIQWEDQFNTARITPASLFYPDAWQNDLWQDGFFEIETTDVIYGTWSIKRATAKFFALEKPIASKLTDAEVETIEKATKAKLITDTEISLDKEEEEDDGTGTITTKTYTYTYTYEKGKFAYDETLWSAIKGAAKNLQGKDKLNLFNGKEIYAQSVSTHHTEAALPMVTPQFALFYRLVYAGDFTISIKSKTEVQP